MRYELDNNATMQVCSFSLVAPKKKKEIEIERSGEACKKKAKKYPNR